MYSVYDTPCGVGFPIRTFPGQSLLAAHRNLSQRVTSFIASQSQGIHQMLLSYLILIRSQIRKSFDPRSETPGLTFGFRLSSELALGFGRNPETCLKHSSDCLVLHFPRPLHSTCKSCCKTKRFQRLPPPRYAITGKRRQSLQILFTMSKNVSG